MNKATARAPTNLAFIKYWGRKDEVLRMPNNGSISVCLDGMSSITTVEFQEGLTVDTIVVNGEPIEATKASKHLDRIRSMAGISSKARVQSINSFPTSTGLSSSASGYAALTVAASKAAGLDLSEKELSILARQGSGSACRSIPDGYVEWKNGNTSEESYGQTIYPADHWDLSFVVAVVSEKPKHVPTSIGQQEASTSPWYETRQKMMPEKIERCKKLIEEKDFSNFGELVEAEAMQYHHIMQSQKRRLIYLSSGSLSLMQLCQKWRELREVEVYYSLNTGQDIYFIVKREDEDKLRKKLESLDFVKEIIVNHPGGGVRLVNEHLF